MTISSSISSVHSILGLAISIVDDSYFAHELVAYFHMSLLFFLTLSVLAGFTSKMVFDWARGVEVAAETVQG